MRILLVHKYWHAVGGVERYVMEVRNAFERLGHEVVPFAMQDPSNLPTPHERYFVPRVEMREGPMPSRMRAAGRAVAGLATVRQLGRLMDELPIDAAHVVHAYHHLGTTFLHTLRRRRIPIVLSVHDYKLGCPNYRLFDERRDRPCDICVSQAGAWAWAPAVRGCWGGSRLAGAALSAEGLVSRGWGTYRRCADAVLVLNHLQRRAAEAAGIPADRIHRVPNFLHIGTQPPVTPARERHVLYVGRLVPEKGVDVLIRACATAGLALRVVGDGRSRPALERLAAELGSDTRFLGELDPVRVQEEMARAAVLGVPSRWPEVWPFVVLEAWDAALPVVGSDVGGISEQLDGERGFLCPEGAVQVWADMLRRVVVTEPDLGQKRAAAARAYALRELAEERWVERMRVVYDQIGVRL